MSAKKLKGPILIFGAGGFIGFNLLLELLKKRTDVFGITHNPENNWRLKTGKVPATNILKCDINDLRQLTKIINQTQPKTIFNLAAYGAYSHQQSPTKIYETNFTSTLNSLECLKITGFEAYVYAGSSSEYGYNCAAPKEQSELLPNSHYAVSKAAVSHLITYYGKVENLPVVHLRLYSAYGPWEEPIRLIPQLVLNAKCKTFPPLVNPTISRDYVYVEDIVRALISSALHIQKTKGSIYNIATGKKTTIRKLSLVFKRITGIQDSPHFSTMPNKKWDLTNWYGDALKFKKATQWTPITSLIQGIKKTIRWHKQNSVWHV